MQELRKKDRILKMKFNGLKILRRILYHQLQRLLECREIYHSRTQEI